MWDMHARLHTRVHACALARLTVQRGKEEGGFSANLTLTLFTHHAFLTPVASKSAVSGQRNSPNLHGSLAAVFS